MLQVDSIIVKLFHVYIKKILIPKLSSKINTLHGCEQQKVKIEEHLSETPHGYMAKHWLRDQGGKALPESFINVTI